MARLARRSFSLVALASLTVSLVAASPAGAAVDPVLASAGAFVVSKQQADGGFEVAQFASFETPDAVLALGELAQTGATWSAAAARTAVTGVVTGGKSPLDYADDQVEAPDLAPTVAAKYLALVVRPLGLDPHDVDPSNDSAQPVDLVTAMGKGADLDGQYRAPAFNGLLFIALAQWSLDCAVPTDLVARIKAAQQANGSWDFSGDPAGTGVDIDTTSLAVIALTRAGLTVTDPVVANALTLLAHQHRANGAWQATVFPPFVDDPNSTALATLAVAATGQDPATAAWRNAAAPDLAGQPYISSDDWLRSQQQSDGHIASPGDAFPPISTFATSQTIEALTRHWFTSKPPSTVVCPLPGGPRGRFLRGEFRSLAGRSAGNADLVAPSQALGPDPTIGAKRFAAVRSTLGSNPYRRGAVLGLYQRALGRAPEEAARAFWADQLQTVSRQSVMASLLGSSEFFHQAGGTDAGFLDALYPAAVGRAADSGGKAFWLGRLAAGASRSSVARTFLVSGEGRRAEVAIQYRALLGRAPDASGSAYWSSRLVTEPIETLIARLVASSEYFTKVTG